MDFLPSYCHFVVSFPLTESPLVIFVSLFQWSWTPLVFKYLVNSVSPSFWMIAFLEILVYGYFFFPFSILDISCNCFLALKALTKTPADCLMTFLLYIIIFLCIAAFNHFSLSLCFPILLTIWLVVDLLLLIFFGGLLCDSYFWMSVSFLNLGSFKLLFLPIIFSPFFLLLYFWNSYKTNVIT